MSKFNKLRLIVMDKHFAEITYGDTPSKGWIKAIRTALGMNLRQLSERLGVSQQSTTQMFK